MLRPRLIDVKTSRLPEAIGLCADDTTRIAAAVNEAQEYLINDPNAPDEGWWGGWARMVFNATVSSQGVYITTPRNVARVILATVCQVPIRIQNGFYEFLEFGIGNQPKNCIRGTSCAAGAGQLTQAYERDTVVTLTDFASSARLIAIYPSDTRDIGKKVIITGNDVNGNPVYSTDATTGQAYAGEQVTLQFPFALTLNQFTAVSGIQKDLTVAPLTFQMLDPTTAVLTSLSSMEPGETTAYYRRYFFNGLPYKCCNTTSGTVQIEAQCKLDYVPVASDPDYLTILSIPAIIEECKARRYSLMDSSSAPQLELKSHARALQLLCGQLDHYIGKTNTAIRVPLFGSQRAKLLPI